MGATEVKNPELWTTKRILEWTRLYFEERGVNSPRLCAELLLAHVLSVRRMDLYVDYERPLSLAERNQYKALVKRRNEGVPVQHLIGNQAFRYLDLIVNNKVLIPRPETEILVDHVLRVLEEELSSDTADSDAPLLRAVDVGTGTGALILSLAKEAKFLFSSLVGVDISAEAIGVALQNAERNGLSDHVEFRESDLLSDFPSGDLDLVVSNPPYIPTADIPELAIEVRQHEPMSALDGGETGLEIIKRLIEQARMVLRSGGILAIEIGFDQGPAVVDILSAPAWASVELHQDLAGMDRVVLARKAGTDE